MDGEKWTDNEDRWLRYHAGDGALALGIVLERSPREIVLHGIDVGIDVPLRPLLGDICPWCGGRVTPGGRGTGAGICDACWESYLSDIKAESQREKRELQRYWTIAADCSNEDRQWEKFVRGAENKSLEEYPTYVLRSLKARIEEIESVRE